MGAGPRESVWGQEVARSSLASVSGAPTVCSSPGVGRYRRDKLCQPRPLEVHSLLRVCSRSGDGSHCTEGETEVHLVRRLTPSW